MDSLKTVFKRGMVLLCFVAALVLVSAESNTDSEEPTRDEEQQEEATTTKQGDKEDSKASNQQPTENASASTSPRPYQRLTVTERIAPNANVDLPQDI